MNKYLTQIGATKRLSEKWNARHLKPTAVERYDWIEVPLPRGVKNGDRVRVELRGNVAHRYVNGVRKADWRIPAKRR